MPSILQTSLLLLGVLVGPVLSSMWTSGSSVNEWSWRLHVIHLRQQNTLGCPAFLPHVQGHICHRCSTQVPLCLVCMISFPQKRKGSFTNQVTVHQEATALCVKLPRWWSCTPTPLCHEVPFHQCQNPGFCCLA